MPRGVLIAPNGTIVGDPGRDAAAGPVPRRPAARGPGERLLVVGLSHRTSPVATREKAALSESAARGVLRLLGEDDAIAESVVLSTCNRTEIYLRATDPAGAERAAAAALVARTRISAGELACARYVRRGRRAVNQLFRVTAGLDSMVTGESEIQGQVRRAWELATEEGASGSLMHHLFRRALETGKRVRSRTGVGGGSASVPAVAVNLAARTLGDLGGARALVIGAGPMAEAAAVTLHRRGVRRLIVCNRTVARSREVAARARGRGTGFEALPAELVAADIVLAATRAPHAVLDAGAVARAMAARPARPLVIVDLSVPRDVETAAGGIDGVALFDIDHLERLVEATLDGRRREARRAEGHVEAAVADFLAWRRGLTAGPAIASLRSRADEIRREELARMEGRWDNLTEADRRRVEALTAGIVNKLLHEPTVRARAAAESGDPGPYLDGLRRLFGIEV